MDLEPIREAAERVARSEGLEIFDVEWKIGKQRLAAGLSRPACRARRTPKAGCHPQRLPARQRAIERDSGCGGSGAGAELYAGSQFAGAGSEADQAGGLRAVRGRLAKIWLNEPVENQKYFGRPAGGYADGIVKLT